MLLASMYGEWTKDLSIEATKNQCYECLFFLYEFVSHIPLAIESDSPSVIARQKNLSTRNCHTNGKEYDIKLTQRER